MARIQLQVESPANRLTLHTLLQAAGHAIVDSSPEIVITDAIDAAVDVAARVPVLVLPAQDRHRCQLRPVVGDNRIRPASPGNDSVSIGSQYCPLIGVQH